MLEEIYYDGKYVSLYECKNIRVWVKIGRYHSSFMGTDTDEVTAVSIIDTEKKRVIFKNYCHVPYEKLCTDIPIIVEDIILGNFTAIEKEKELKRYFEGKFSKVESIKYNKYTEKPYIVHGYTRYPHKQNLTIGVFPNIRASDAVLQAIECIKKSTTPLEFFERFEAVLPSVQEDKETML